MTAHVSPVLPGTVGVYGGGRMGAGIAHAFLAAGSEVVVVETDEAAVAAARERVATSLLGAEERGKLEGSAAEVLARLDVTTDPAALAAAGLVVEAVPEDPDLKARVLGAIQDAAPDAVLATNTSSLSIDGLAAGLRRARALRRPALLQPGARPATWSRSWSARPPPRTSSRPPRRWVGALGKTAITVTDSPGFASSRLGVAIALEAMRMLEEGVASAADIDTAMTLGYRHPVGPLRTTDLVGLDVRLAIAEHLAREVGPRFDPPQILRDKVAAGELGRKTGRGFYDW